MGQSGPPLVGSYDHRLVLLSILIAISVSYAALDLGGRVTAARGRIRLAWLAGGATAMGLGIWSMHFTGMMAFSLPVPVAYDWPTVLLSVLTAILASSVALYVVSRKDMRRAQAVTGSVLMGLGIVGMHYIGMDAMRLTAVTHYSPLLVSISVFVAVIASLAAIVFTFDYREDFRGTTLAKVISAGVMGAAISAMHYTGMMSASFIATTALPDVSHAVSVSFLGLSGIAIGTLVVQGGAILTSSVDRQLARQAQELETSERFRQIAENLPVAMALANADFTELLYINHAYEAIWGRKVETFYAEPMSFMEGVHPEDRGYFAERIQRLIEGEPINDLECRVVRPDGSISWVTCRGFPIRDDQGRVYRLVGSAQDVTKAKEAEEALRTSEREQRRIAEQLERERARLVEAQEVANVGSWELELQSLNVIWSEQSHHIFETDPSRFKPTRPGFIKFIHPEDRPKVDAAFEESLGRTSPRAIEYRIVMPDGRVKFLEERWKIIRDEQGRPVRLAGTCRDITERVRAEEELRRLSGRLLRLQDEERRKIARDLHDSTGQNLVALATMLGQLNSSIPPIDRNSPNLLSECKALADQCISEVRTLSYVLHPPVLESAGLVEAIHDYVEGFTRRSGIQVELELSPSLERMAGEIEVALFRVVQESLANIQRHSGSQQAKIRIDFDSDLILEIIDHGPGALGSSRDANAPFEFGMGLLSMNERVDLIGGWLVIDHGSQGTTVRVTIPMDGKGT